MKRIINAITSFILTATLICSMIAPVFAKEAKKLTDRDLVEQSLYVVTLNIKGGRHQVDDPNKKITIDYNLSHIANAIIKLAPDIVGFQEIDKNTTRSQNQDQIKILAEKTGYPYYQFTKAIDYQGGEYGHAILSRYPIVSYEATTIPAFKKDHEVRALSHAVIDVNGTHINFFNTHINSGSDGTSQHAFDKIAEVITKFDNAILTGDFNAKYSTGYFSTFSGFKCVNVGNHTTTWGDGNSIDNICYSKEFTPICSGVVNEMFSDHRLVYGLFTFKRK